MTVVLEPGHLKLELFLYNCSLPAHLQICPEIFNNKVSYLNDSLSTRHVKSDTVTCDIICQSKYTLIQT